MIVSFEHKGLEEFYRFDVLKGINAKHEKRLREILTTLDFLESLGKTSLKKYKLHPLTADLRGYWSVKVNASWRVIFRYVDEYDVGYVNYVNYHN